MQQAHAELSNRPRSRSPRSEGGSADWQISFLKGSFGALVERGLDITQLLEDAELADKLLKTWRNYGGLLVLRGLTELTPGQLAALSGIFGELEPQLDDSKKQYQVDGVPCVMRLGNTRDSSGTLTAVLAKDPPLPQSGSPQYREAERVPVWHTDSTYRKTPPIGSLLYCKQAPPEGAATCFADMHGAHDALDEATHTRLEGLECVCSLAHHDAKVHSYSPDYPTLLPEQRAANPAQRVPMILRHPLTGRRALYGMNASTCAILPRGATVTQEQMDKFELDAVEDPSVQEWRSLLPFVTSDCFTVKWQWKPGDLVVWDNRCTIHCATGFDASKYTREMWRTTLAADRLAPASKLEVA